MNLAPPTNNNLKLKTTCSKWPRKGTRIHESAAGQTRTWPFRLFVFLRASCGSCLPSAQLGGWPSTNKPTNPVPLLARKQCCGARLLHFRTAQPGPNASHTQSREYCALPHDANQTLPSHIPSHQPPKLNLAPPTNNNLKLRTPCSKWPREGTRIHDNAAAQSRTWPFRLFVFLRASCGSCLPSAQLACSV